MWFLFLWQSLFNISERALQYIIRFLKYFINLLANTLNNEQLKKASNELPLTTKTAMKLLGLDAGNDILQYVVCPKCQSIYEYDDCVITLRNGSKVSKLCHFVRYPTHPHQSKREPCNTPLLETVQKNRLVPYLVYPYHPLCLSLRHLAFRPGFLSSCEKWRQRESTVPPDLFGDVYDGLIWKKFRQSFLSAPYSYLLSLNVDWFQPFKHTQYSVGAIYLVIQNLPREERYKEENVILVGVIPGPHEPHLTVNTYLLPLIEELSKSYSQGIQVVGCGGVPVTVRLLLSCVSCDIPATRKVCGFLGHNSRLGCNKMLQGICCFSKLI